MRSLERRAYQRKQKWFWRQESGKAVVLTNGMSALAFGAQGLSVTLAVLAVWIARKHAFAKATRRYDEALAQASEAHGQDRARYEASAGAQAARASELKR